MELLDCMVILLIVFPFIYPVFPIMVIIIYLLTTNVVIPFPHILANMCFEKYFISIY